MKNGIVTETYPNGDKYVGEFKNGVYHGKGVYTTSDGKKDVGEWKDEFQVIDFIKDMVVDEIISRKYWT